MPAYRAGGEGEHGDMELTASEVESGEEIQEESGEESQEETPLEDITVRDLASEFKLKTAQVIAELKKIGVWVPSPDTSLDQDIGGRIQRRLQLMLELQQEEIAKAEKEKEKKKQQKQKAAVAKPRKAARKSIRQLGKSRPAAPKPKKVEVVEEEPVVESPLASSMKPRKGKASYRRIGTAPEAPPERVEVSIDDEPLIERVEAQVSAEALEAMQPDVMSAEMTQAIAEEQKTAPAREVQAAAPAAPPAAPPQEKAEPASGTAAGKPSRKRPALAGPPRKLKIIKRPEPVPEAPGVDEAAELEQPAAAAAVEEAPAAQVEAAEAVAAEPKEITLPETITVKELSEKIGVMSKDVLRELMGRGIMATINQTLDQTVAEEVCLAFQVIPHFVSFEEAVIEEERVEEKPEDLVTRGPVVTVMGHVDHGKTSLLDAIRETNVASGEAGGITQHIGAYHVDVKGQKIVFVDTPGHEAFTMMRSRGASVTDIVVLVVAADDGVMPQTKEAIDHARAADVPIIVAVNKIDKPGADAQRVKKELTEYELVPSDWGGDTEVVEVSAKEGTNLEQLLEIILLVAELLELQANPQRAASGTVLEAKLDKGRGAVASVLVQNGTLAVGDSFIAGTAFGKVRALFDDLGHPVKKAGPSSAVEILGLQGLPQAGDSFQVIEDVSRARQIVEHRQDAEREQERARSSKISLDELYAQMQAGEVKELPIVLKADAQGSIEVLRDTLEKLSTEKVKINIIHRGVGAISESDVLLASTSAAIVIGFNVRPEQNADAAAEKEGVEIRLYTVIYEIAKDIRGAMVGLLEPTLQEAYQGRAEVRQTFGVPKYGTVAGSYVLDGVITRNSEVRLLRDNVVVYQGKLDSLRRFKDDVNEVRTGYECGISIANFNDIKPGDVIEAFVKEEVAPELT